MTRLRHIMTILSALMFSAGPVSAQEPVGLSTDQSLPYHSPPDAVAVTYNLAFVQQPTVTNAGVVITPAIRIQLRDSGGRNVLQSGISILLSLSSGSGMLSGTTTKVTDSLGVATYNDLSIDLIGTKQLKASGSSVKNTTSASFSITLGPAARLRIQTEPSSSATAGVPFSRQPVIYVEDAGGNRVTTDNRTVVAASRLGGAGTLQGVLAATAQSGIARFANLSHNVADSITILFSAGTLTPDTSAVVLVNPATAARVVFVQPPTPAGAGALIAPPVTVGLRDAYGNELSTTGTSVSVALTSGTGTLSGTLTRKTESGIATFSNLSINLIGPKVLRATSGIMTAAVSDTFVISPGPPKALTFVVQPSPSVAGVPIAPAITVQARDSLGNAVSQASLPITLALASGTGTLSGTLIQNTSAAGVATFSNVSVNLVGTKTLSASSPGLVGATSSPFVISTGPAAALAFIQQPTNAGAGTSIAPAVTIQVKDAQGNNRATAGISVNLTLSSGTGEMTGTFPQITNASGLATFSNLSINLVGVKQLSASAAGLTPAVSSTFTIQSGPPARLHFTTSPSGGAAGTPFATQPVVTLEDLFGNPVGEVAQTVTLSIHTNAGPGGTLLGTKTAVVNPLTARAVFATIAIDKAGAGYTLTATGSTVSTTPGSVISTAFTVTAGQPRSIRVENAPDGTGILLSSQTITSGTSVLVYAVSRDSFSNFVANVAADIWALGAITGGVAIEDLVPAPDRKSAIFTGKLTGTARITASAAGLTSVPTGTLTVVVGGTPSQIRVETAANGTGATVGARTIQSGTALTVYAIGRDAAGNFVANIAAQTWSLQNKTAGIVDTDLAPAADKKSATFTGHGAGSARVRATSGSLAATSSGLLTVVAGPATQMAAHAGSQQSTNVRTAFPTRFAALVRDAAGNPARGVQVIWTAPLSGASGKFEDGGSSALSDSTGIATAGPFTANTVAGTYEVIASIPTAAATAPFVLTNRVGVPADIATAMGSSQSSRVGTSFPEPLVAIVQDSLGNAVSNVAVTFTVPAAGPGGTFSNGSDTARVTTDAGGLAVSPVLTANAAVGAFRARATTHGIADTAWFDLLNTPGPPAGITAAAGSFQATSVGTPFATRLSAAVHDSLGNPLSGVRVFFAAPTAGAGGTFPGGLLDSVFTDATGLARANTLTANTIADSFTVEARLFGSSSPAIFRLFNRAGPVDTFLIDAAGGGGFGTRTALVPFAIRIVALDQHGNTAAQFTGTADITSNGVLAPSTSLTPSFKAGVLASHVVVIEQAGRCALRITRTGGAETGRTDTFQVINPSPSIISMSPSSGYRGQTLTVSVVGSGFIPGVTALSLGDLITTSTAVRSSTQLDVTLTIDTGATNGTRDVFVFNGPPGGGVGTLNTAFVIGNNPIPLLTAISPGRSRVLDRLEVVLHGENFVSGITQVQMGPGILVNTTRVDSGTRLTADISIIGPNAGGVHAIRVANSPPGGGQSDTLTFIVDAPPTVYPVPASPADSSSIVDPIISFQWATWLPDGIAYRLQVSQTPAFISFVLDTALVDTILQLSHLARGTPYFWRISAWNTVGSSAYSPVRMFSLTAPYPAAFTLHDSLVFPVHSSNSTYQAKDYRLVGLPGNSTAPIDGLLVGSQNVDWVAYWDNGEASNYLVAFNGSNTFAFATGRAFWILRKGPLLIQATVPSVPLDSMQCVQIPLHPGWNLITDPYPAPVPWAWIQSANGPAALADPWGFDGVFTRASSLEPYRGYLFDNADNRTSLRIPFAWPVAKHTPWDAADQWRIDITLSSEGFIATTASLGISHLAREQRDPLDLRMPRGIGDMPGVVFDRPAWTSGGDLFVTDIRPAVEPVQSWPLEVRTPAHQPAQLAFEGVENVPGQYQVMIVDEAHANAVDLRRNPVYRFDPPSPVSRFRVIVGTTDAVGTLLDDLLPREFSLGANFPNPFNPTTTIPVAVPRTAEVSLKVYNLLGAEVHTLFQGTLRAGRYWFVWNGANAHGRPVASGVYLLEFAAVTGVRLTGKMLLVR